MKQEEFQECHGLWEYDDFMETALGYTGFDQEKFNEFVPTIFDMILSREEKDPAKMYEGLIEDLRETWPASDELPVHGGWHHFIVPGIILTALRNAGYEISRDDIMEGLQRGTMTPGGGCGFHGICGAGTGLGIVLSIIHRSNPIHDRGRSEAMGAVSEAFKRISNLGGPRCCPMSTYTTINLAVRELRKMGYDLPLSEMKGRCLYYEVNDECHEEGCPYYPDRG